MKKLCLLLATLFVALSFAFAQAPVLGTYPATTVGISGNITVTPTAAPANTTSITASTAAAFKGKMVVNPITGTLTITNAYPAGVYTISVKVFNSTASATTTFQLTVAPPPCGQALFPNTTNTALSNTNRVYLVADFNNDGKPDIVVSNFADTSITVLFGNGTGGFGGSAITKPVQNLGASAVADFNGDGKMDFASSSSSTNNVTTYLGNGSGGFTSYTSVSVQSYPTALAAGDFNSDGRADLAVTNLSGNTVSIRLGNGAGGFTGTTNLATGAAPGALEIADLNRDGKQDIVVINATDGTLSVFLGDGAGGFGTATTLPVGNGLQFISVADFNGDDIPDIIASVGYSGLTLFPGTGTGSFGTGKTIVVAIAPVYVIPSDFNGDGKMDFVLMTRSNNYVASVWLGDGAGNFIQNQSTGLPQEAFLLALADFNSDGRQDIVYGYGYGNAALPNGFTILPGSGDNAEINLLGNNTSIADGDNTPDGADHTDFGNASTSLTRTYTIQNTGTGGLPVGSIKITGPDSVSFVPGGITLPIIIQAGSTTTFTLRFTPNTSGTKTATVNISNGDCSEKLYDFAVQATGVPATVSPGQYPPGIIATAGANATVIPSAAPTNTVSLIATAPASFKGLLLVDSLSGAVTVTNAHPSGSYLITVKAANGFSSDTTSFLLTVGTTTGCNKGLFIPATDVPTGINPLAIAIADVNGDGKQDIATANNTGDNVTIRLGNGAGGFTTGSTAATGITPRALAFGDFNGDGKADMAVVSGYSNAVSIRLGDGAGNFSGFTEVSVGNSPQAIAVGDFNKDGRQDFAVVNASSNTVSVRLGDGTGRFSGTTEIAVGNNPSSVVVADFNNDSNLDLAVSNAGSNSVSIRLGNGLGGFNNAADVAVGNFPTSLVIADFNGDGNTDFSLVNRSSYSVSIRLGNGTGGFTAATGLTVLGFPEVVATGDFNTDGKPDLAIIDNYVNAIAIRLGTGTGAFTSVTSTVGGVTCFSLAVGDFDGDGRQDIAVADTVGSRILVRLGSTNEMTLSGNGLTIVDGDATPDASDGTDFGNVSSVKTNLYTIRNDGPANLTISSIVLSGTDAGQYRIDSIVLPVTIPAATVDTFAIRFIPTSAGVKSATITINNDDCDESVYDFAVQATGVVSIPTLGTYADSVVVATGGKVSVTPSAPPGDAVSITAFTSPRFKGLLGINPQTGILTVTNAQPTGRYPVTIKTVNGFSSATTSFMLVVTGTACSQGQFANAADVAVTGTLQVFAIADFNGDGNQDIAATGGSTTVSIRLGNGMGGFTAVPDVGAGAGPNSVAAGDFNGDGKMDMAITNGANNTVSIRLGTGDGSFVSSQALSAGTAPNTIVTADFNGDGKADIAYTNQSSNNAYIRLGTGEGRFGAATAVTTGSGPGSMVVSDFNGDGKADLAIANMGAVTASIRLGDGLGNFTAAPDITTGSNVFSIAAADFNGDGKIDLAIGNAYSNVIVVRLGDGAGNFSGTTSYTLPYGPYALVAGDFNGDSKPDIAAVLNFRSVIILPGNGAGGFTVPTTSVIVGATPRALAVGDFNNDGRLDFVASSTDPVIAIRLNTPNDITVKGNNTAIANGDNTPSVTDFTDFGTITTAATFSRTFTIQNTGNGDLVISRITFSGSDSARFSRSGITLPATIAAGASQTFTVTFSPVEGGIRNAVVNMVSDNCDKGTYTFAIRAKATCTTLSANNVWLGNTANWNTASNWSLGVVPNGCGVAVINAGVPFMPQISTNASCYSLMLNNGATFTVTGTGSLTITGP